MFFTGKEVAMGEYVSAHDVARHVVEVALNEKTPVTNLQLQKILFFLQCNYSKRHDGAMLFSDDFEAWQYGPVVPSVYFDYSDFGGTQITEPVLISHSPGRGSFETHPLDQAIATDIAPYLSELLCRPAWSLVDESHRSGGPWDITFNGGRGKRNVISKELIVSLCA